MYETEEHRESVSGAAAGRKQRLVPSGILWYAVSKYRNPRSSDLAAAVYISVHLFLAVLLNVWLETVSSAFRLVFMCFYWSRENDEMEKIETMGSSSLKLVDIRIWKRII